MAVAQALGKGSGTDLLTDTAIVRSSEITEKLLCLLVMKPAKQLAATWSVHGPEQRNAAGKVAVPMSPLGSFVEEPANTHIATKENETSFECDTVLKAGREKQFPRVNSNPMVILNNCAMINLENCFHSHVWIPVCWADTSEHKS